MNINVINVPMLVVDWVAKVAEKTPGRMFFQIVSATNGDLHALMLVVVVQLNVREFIFIETTERIALPGLIVLTFRYQFSFNVWQAGRNESSAAHRFPLFRYFPALAFQAFEALSSRSNPFASNKFSSKPSIVVKLKHMPKHFTKSKQNPFPSLFAFYLQSNW